MILAKARIGEFDQFLSVFEGEGADHRRKFGSKGARVLRNADDPNEVWVLFDWEKEDYMKFLADPTSQQIMGSAGLQGPPESIAVDDAGTVDS